MMEEGEGEDLDIDDIIAQYGAFDDTTMGRDEEEVAAEDDLGDALGDAIHDAQQECESEKGKVKFERMLDDHRKLLYRRPKRGKKSWVQHWNYYSGRQRMVYPTRHLGIY